MRQWLGRNVVANTLLLCLIIPSAALAQDAVSASAVVEGDKATCELHVWPGQGFHSVYYGWAHGGTIDGAEKGRKGYPPLPDNPLSSEVQLGLLKGLPLAQSLGLSGYKTVLHNQPLTSTQIRSNSQRQLPETPPCYAELMVDNMVFQNNVLSGKWLNVLIRFRQFDSAGATPKRTFGNFMLERLKLFPPEEETIDPKPALDELRAGYAQALSDFGQAMAKAEAASAKKSAGRKPGSK